MVIYMKISSDSMSCFYDEKSYKCITQLYRGGKSYLTQNEMPITPKIHDGFLTVLESQRMADFFELGRNLS